MARLVPLIICLSFAWSSVWAEAVKLRAVSRAEELYLVRHTVPLPKEIRILKKAVVPRGAVGIEIPREPDRLISQALKELSAACGGRASSKAAFTIKMILGGGDAELLAGLKNSEQAYRIMPGVSGKGIKLIALEPQGLYYAAKTLQQLISARRPGREIEIPLANVTDWPDMEDRGLWGSDNYEHLKWMSDRKMNLVEQICAIGVDENGRPFGRLKEGREPMVNEAPLYGMKPVPVLLHLEQSGSRIIAAYPELKGKTEHEGVLCYSKPKTSEMIAGWIAALADLPNVSEVDVWMTENLHGMTGCQCDLCRAQGVDPLALEARAIVKAWKIAEEHLGRHIGIRILTSEATEHCNKEILSELPRDVKVVYYHSLLTYTSGRAPMIHEYLQNFVKRGGWLSVCPDLNPGMAAPFTSAQFVHYRANEYVTKGLSGFLGYATPRVHYCRYNVEAAAEYTWNARGRSTYEFAISWAIRQGLKHPQEFAQYAEAVGAVLWDVYGSDWPKRIDHPTLGPVEQQLREGKVPDIGFVLWDYIRVPFGNFRDASHLKADVALAERAVTLAKRMGKEEFIQESLIAQGLIRSLEALYELKSLVKEGRVAPADKPAATHWFRQYIDGMRQAAAAAPKWERTVRRSTDPENFTSRMVSLCEEGANRMASFAAELGIDIGG